MKIINVFLSEFTHFFKTLSKFFTYLIFIVVCCYSIYNGFDLHDKHQLTILEIKEKQENEINQILDLFDRGRNNLEAKPWVDLYNPYWALNYVPVYVVKNPSSLLPLGIGQAEQYGFYKKITNWSSTYDNDMVEELANPERLVNGNLDFAFMIIFLIPILLIILTYNIRGLEQDYRFEKLIIVQFGSIHKWVFLRFLFYVILLILTTSFFIISVGIINNSFQINASEIISLIILSSLYVLFFALTFYFITITSSGTSSIAFKMISVWLLFCVIIPASVHQFASIKYPVNYMTEFLDVNRKEAYEIFELPVDSLYDRLVDIYPALSKTTHGMSDEISNVIIGNTVSAIVNQMNKEVIMKIEENCQKKNKLIESTYFFNPISFMQNKWNYLTSSDFYSYKAYRAKVQSSIDKKLELLNEECWEDEKVSRSKYLNYLSHLKVF